MSSSESPPRNVPTLTEVVEWPEVARLPVVTAAVAVVAAVDPAEAPQGVAPPESELAAEPVVEPVSDTAPALPTEAQRVEYVLNEVQRQIDLMLEYRLREALLPLLARATEGLIRDARSELASTLRDVVTRAVAQEAARHRPH